MNSLIPKVSFAACPEERTVASAAMHRPAFTSHSVEGKRKAEVRSCAGGNALSGRMKIWRGEGFPVQGTRLADGPSVKSGTSLKPGDPGWLDIFSVVP